MKAAGLVFDHGRELPEGCFAQLGYARKLRPIGNEILHAVKAGIGRPCPSAKEAEDVAPVLFRIAQPAHDLLVCCGFLIFPQCLAGDARASSRLGQCRSELLLNTPPSRWFGEPADSWL